MVRVSEPRDADDLAASKSSCMEFLLKDQFLRTETSVRYIPLEKFSVLIVYVCKRTVISLTSQFTDEKTTCSFAIFGIRSYGSFYFDGICIGTCLLDICDFNAILV